MFLHSQRLIKKPESANVTAAISSGFSASNEWEASVLRALAASSVSNVNGSASHGLLLLRGLYVRQRDIRSLLAPRVHPALLDSVITTVLPLHAPTSSLAQLAATGKVTLIRADEDANEPLVLLTDLLAALSKLSLQLGLEF